ncbi:hypothetical protein GCM10009129_13650 [Psychrobacter aestuarii]|uniref:Uncharacterized protein n=2 Tax=Psychrobacter aestuarii TaxID=556327 RepID=A0ABP3FGI0_9GAMM
MNQKDTLELIAIFIFIGGMLSWMITYQLCIVYFRRNKKDISYILYSDETYYDKKMDGYDIHFFYHRHG